MKRLALLFGLAILSLSCARHDDIALWNKVIDMNLRIDRLEALCNRINTNIQAFDTIISSLENKDFVESISPVIENGIETGYVITFSKSGSITIYHGKDGKDGEDGEDGAPGEAGSTPVIGVRQHSDNQWYWTINGEWLFDSNGRMVPVTGNDGATPMLKIVDGLWYVSYDNGSTWEGEPLGPATGEQGDPLIENIDYDNNNIYITLPDGYTLTIPYKKSLKVTFLLGSDIIDTENTVIAIQQYIVSNVKISVENGSKDTFISIHDTKTSSDSGATPSWNIGLNDIDPGSTYSFGADATLKITSHQKASSASVVIMVSDGDFTIYKELKFRCAKEGEVLPPAETIKDLSSGNGTANCYIVSQTGNYRFKASRGNSESTIGGVEGVEVLWETFGSDTAPSKGDLIKSVLLSGNDIIFSTADVFQEGNALIAAKDAYGNILWSWHIWMVADEIKEQDYPNNAGTYMDRNLGAVSCEPNSTGALGLLYQWGRKDPFAGASSPTMNTMALISSEWPQPIQSASGIDIEYSVKHPTTFILCDPYSYDWYYSGSTATTDNTRWSRQKTIYDPCPAGWRVADADDWLAAGFSSTYNTSLHGIQLSLSNEKIWLPGAGYLDPFQFMISGIAYYGNIWTVNAEENGTSAAAIGYSDYSGLKNYKSMSRRASGLSVRCQKYDGTIEENPDQEGSETKPASNQIFYISEDESVVEPKDTDVFGAAIVSNVYENGIGTITFDGPISSIGKNAFSGKSKLIGIYYPDTVTSIGAYAFSSTGLTGELTISDNITSIGYGAFMNCTYLYGKLTIGKNVAEIGNMAFVSSSQYTGNYSYHTSGFFLNFVDVYCKAQTPPSIQPPTLQHLDLSYYYYYYGTFGYHDCEYGSSPRAFYVPTGTTEAYEASNWGTYSSTIKEYTF